MISLDEALAAFDRIKNTIANTQSSARLEFFLWGLIHHRLSDLADIIVGEERPPLAAKAIRQGWDDLDRAIGRRLDYLTRNKK